MKQEFDVSKEEFEALKAESTKHDQIMKALKEVNESLKKKLVEEIKAWTEA